MMDERKLPDKKFGSVKAAVSCYGERVLEGNNPAINAFQTNYPEKNILQKKPYNKTRALHQAKRDTNQLKEGRTLAESVIAEAKSELSAAKKTVKDLTRKIEELNSRGKAQMHELEKLKVNKIKEGEWESGNSFQCEQVMRELALMKRELSKLKLDMASVSEEKRRAEKETEPALSKTESLLNSVDALNKEIEGINEEHVLVELARIEAIKEYEEIEAQRCEMAEKYSATIDETRKRKQEMIQETENAKELEINLATTVSDINMLESELKQVREMDKKGFERNEISRYRDESGNASLLESVLKELEVTKNEMALVKEESFQLMASMDVVRNELTHVVDQTAQLKKKEEKTEMNIQNLNSKLLRAKAKLEVTSEAEEKSKSIASNLTLMLEHLKSETETAKKERTLISEEASVIQVEIQRIEAETDSAEKRLQSTLQELRVVKQSESESLESLKSLIEKTMRNRDSAAQASSTITISKYEYDYLTGNAAAAKEIADEKVAAAEAWVEALKASEKENHIKSELLRRATRQLRVEEEYKIQQTERSMSAKEINEDDFEKWRQMMEPKIGFPSKALSRSIKKMTPTITRRAKSRKSGTSFTVRRRKKVMPNLSKLFTGKGIESNL